MTTTYLITGASRGFGRYFVETFLSRPSTTVIACVRDPTTEHAKSLTSLAAGDKSTLHIVKLDSLVYEDAAAAVAEVKKLGITHLDVVIPNAGVSKDFAKVADVTPKVLMEHIDINSLAPLWLFQATIPLLQPGSKFVFMGSGVATIGNMEERPFPCAAYGASKALANWYTRKIHFEHEDLISFAVDPVFVQTDMGNHAAQALGMDKAYLTLEETAPGCVDIIDKATREKTGGTWQVYDGTTFPW